MSINLDLSDLRKLQRLLRQLGSNAWISATLEEQIPELRRINRSQFDLVARTTRYSPGYVGRLKPSRLRRAGGEGDRGYARDTLALFDDLTSNIEASGTTLESFSDLGYAQEQADILTDKEARGEAREASFFADDDVYFDLVEVAIADRVEELWRK